MAGFWHQNGLRERQNSCYDERMKIKLVEGGDLQELVYRPWNGVQYGANEAAAIVKQYVSVPFDRSAGAYIMQRAAWRFWATYLEQLAEDERAIREAYLVYHPADVEDALRRELDLAGDDPRLHHRARQAALDALAEAYPRRAKDLVARPAKVDYTLNVRFNHRTDRELIDYLHRAHREGETRSAALKRLMRIGLEYQLQIDTEREAVLAQMRQEDWLNPL